MKRSPDERKKLPKDLEAFARGDEEKLRVRRPRVDRGSVNDPREGYTVAGVANRDARSVYDVRVETMRGLWAGGKPTEANRLILGEMLLDAVRLRLWKARRVTGFEVLAEDVVGVPVAQAKELVKESAQRLGESEEQLDERTVALWMRTEAGLYEGDPQARVRVRGAGPKAVIDFSVTLATASAALAGVGARHVPLAREQADRGGQREQRGSFDDAPEYAAPRTRRASVVAEEPVDGVVDDAALELSEPAEGVEAGLSEAEAVEGAPAQGEGEGAPARQTVPAVPAGTKLVTRKARPAGEERDQPVARRFERPAPGDRAARAERPAGGRDEPRPFRARAERTARDERPERPRRVDGDRPRFGGEQRGAGTRFDGERPRRTEGRSAGKSFGDRPAGKSFGDRPAGKSFGDRPAGRGFGDRPAGKSFGDRPAGKSFGTGGKREGGERLRGAEGRLAGKGYAAGKSFGDRPAGKRDGGDRPRSYEGRGTGGKSFGAAGGKPGFGGARGKSFGAAGGKKSFGSAGGKSFAGGKKGAGGFGKKAGFGEKRSFDKAKPAKAAPKRREGGDNEE